MNDIHPDLPPQLEAAMQQFYAASQPDSTFTAALETKLRRHQAGLLRSSKRRCFGHPETEIKKNFRTRPLLAVLAALLGLLLLTGLVYAVGRLSGFIPGFGFTSPDGTVCVLAQPVENTSGDLRLQVRQAVSDGEHFWLDVSLSGIREDPRYRGAYIMLPDGERISFISGADSAVVDGSVEMTLLFPPLPGNPDAASLLLEDLQGRDVTLDFRLRPAQAHEILPVSVEGILPLQSEVHHGVSLVLDNVALDAEKTVFQVSLRFARPHTWVTTDWNVSLSDEQGVPYPLRDITPATMAGGDAHIYQTVPFSGEEQLLLTLVTFPPSQHLPMFVDLSAQAPSFVFDPGENPQPGQSWKMHHELSAEGFDVTVTRATLVSETELLFEIEAGGGVSGVTFTASDERLKGSSGGILQPSGSIEAGVRFTGMPVEPFEVRLMRVYDRAEGPWHIHWNPPAAPAAQPGAATATTAPLLTAVPTPTLSEEEPLLQRVQRLLRKFDASLRQEPAWVHVVSVTHSTPRAGQTFPPSYLKTETWTQVDHEGYVTASIHIDTDESGAILQQSVTQGNDSVNFTTGDTLDNSSRHLFSLDTVSYYVAAALQNGSRVLQEEVACENGNTCLMLVLEDHSPILNPAERETVVTSGQRVWIELESGKKIKEQRYWLLEDGSEKITMTCDVQVVEVVTSPPQEMLDLLNRVSVP